MHICADDYGMAAEVDRGIEALAAAGVVDRVSVMAVNRLHACSELFDGVGVGLHVSFTVSSGLSLLRYPERTLKNSILRQLRFVREKGYSIRHIDVHRHLHLLPPVRRALMEVAYENSIARVRCLTMPSRRWLGYLSALLRHGFAPQVPKMLLAYGAGAGMKRAFDRAGTRYCRTTVLMPLAGGGDYAGLLRTLLHRFAGSDAELVTHPGIAAARRYDAYTDGRAREFEALNSTVAAVKKGCAHGPA
jgi:predicted glycoside hydrolase/deacetylase ChbG (UPF0249 family)